MPVAKLAIDTSIVTQNTDGALLQPRMVVIHCCGYAQEKMLRILTKPSIVHDQEITVSAHYFLPALRYWFQEKLETSSRYQLEVEKLNAHQTIDYPVFQLLSENIQAWHSGVSYWCGSEKLYRQAIGIELHQPNYGNALITASDAEVDFNHFEFYPLEQIEALIILLKEILDRHPTITANQIWGHSDISPWRLDARQTVVAAKTDPGLHFPWEKLAQAGLSVWPRKQRQRRGVLRQDVLSVQTLLRGLGYQLDLSGVVDEKMRWVLRTFKMHFFPEDYLSLEVTEEIAVALENLVDGCYEYPLYSSL